MPHIATVRTRGGDYQSSTSKDRTRPQDGKEFRTFIKQTTHNKHTAIHTYNTQTEHIAQIHSAIIRHLLRCSLLEPVG